jgi:hypothetical protein
MAPGNPPEYSPGPGLPTAIIPFPFFHNPRHFKRNRPLGSRLKMRCGNANWDRVSDPFIETPER